MPEWVIFTDLDGSLLDHDTYRWEPAKPWLARLRAARVPVIITTSKTAAEVAPLQHSLGLSDTPFIAENGASVTLPAPWVNHPDFPHKVFSANYPRLCRILNSLRSEQSFNFRGFSDMTDAEVAGITGLPQSDAALARRRQGSEPLIWLGNHNELERFAACLKPYQLALTQGGRFYHVMGESVSKGHAVEWLTKHYQQRTGSVMTTLGLGDGPNDRSLLEATQYAVIIKGAVSDKVTLSPEYHGEVYRTESPGPRGWSEGLSHYLSQFITY
ncbi:mannosyl-3-phosphoglycerate phosphatase [Lonsdalea populi]|uniref:Mannosyl-3-phosphoglycerate phosphatase-related protein n=2 Tax=Lonsdalea populi TaxID=1172565 RepID=A0A3N0UW48_9GAMM|nr:MULTISPECIES: mannosyl-3-phosphoglycerate phosphatase-related protein [Lonsdalea]OSN02600.1 mannosyl-3-phosphoglycerate phosphatase [Lonsdalea populi]QPQ25642.1 mannosyl-3-phosphoglycerate phosphatase-related protein [Lonsdalea populi]RAT18167.1 mannosyl-3-phosphoglycerate phosphatase [Lonsdalea quercina]RAT31034.1 mannosyl-3-phosphoglycerate phosphatase [Lonsdalea populi]RAT40081.1 mannosyl-3-phosphoglycerate phosphatase [Lonsdalea populi]